MAFIRPPLTNSKYRGRADGAAPALSALTGHMGSVSWELTASESRRPPGPGWLDNAHPLARLGEARDVLTGPRPCSWDIAAFSFVTVKPGLCFLQEDEQRPRNSKSRNGQNAQKHTCVRSGADRSGEMKGRWTVTTEESDGRFRVVSENRHTMSEHLQGQMCHVCSHRDATTTASKEPRSKEG